MYQTSVQKPFASPSRCPVSTTANYCSWQKTSGSRSLGWCVKLSSATSMIKHRCSGAALMRSRVWIRSTRTSGASEWRSSETRIPNRNCSSDVWFMEWAIATGCTAERYQDTPISCLGRDGRLYSCMVASGIGIVDADWRGYRSQDSASGSRNLKPTGDAMCGIRMH